MTDISDTLIAKSDQLNAADLSQPITVRVDRVTKVRGDEQPVVVHIDGHQPWKPCKTMRRLLGRLWGTNADVWAGRYVRLYNDPSVRWAGKEVGGIRVSGMSHLKGRELVRLPVSKGKYGEWTVEPLQIEAPPTLAEVLESQGKTLADADVWCKANNKPRLSTEPPNVQADAAQFFAANPGVLRDFRAGE